jgi:hypothetical protein
MDLNADFTQVLDDLTTQSHDIAKYIMSGSTDARSWMIPTNATDFDPTDIENLGEAFNRDDLNSEYADQLKGSDTDCNMGNIMADNAQLAYMMMWERSFRERHKTDVRMRMHLAGRRKAHGDDQHGIHIGCVKDYVQSFIDNADSK